MSHQSRLARWLPIAAAAALLPFANGRWSLPAAAWLAPMFLMRFFRTQPLAIALPVGYALSLAAFMLGFHGMVPVAGPIYAAVAASIALATVAPYALDRWMAPRLPLPARALVFPAAATALQFLGAFGKFATWGTAAYAHFGDLPLVQLASVTGLWGIDFVVFLLAPVANELWQSRAARPSRNVALAYATLVALVYLGGALRLLTMPPSPTVRVASLTRTDDAAAPPSPETFARLVHGGATARDRADFAAWAAAVDDDLLARADREAAAGARVVFWDEGGAPVLKPDEPALIARGAALAARRNIYLGMALGTWTPGAPKPLENKFVLVEPSGRVAWEYHKSRPVPGSEAAVVAPGDGVVRTLDAPIGSSSARLAAVICFDADHPRLLRQAGAGGADIVLDPSNDWRAIDPWHTRMASFRAVEEGVSLVRQTRDGRSAAYDPRGATLAEMDHFTSTDRVMVAEVPTRGVHTIYARFGDWLGWLSVALFALLLGRALRSKKVPLETADPAFLD